MRVKEERLIKAVDKVLKDIEQSPNDEDRIERIIGLVEPAKDDLKASMLLFNSELFALSVYHLQQGVEKTTKAYLLSTKIVSVEEINKIRHHSLNGHILLIQKMLGYAKELGVNLNSVVSAKTSLELFKKINREEVAKLSYSEIMKLVESSNSPISTNSKMVSDKVEQLLDRDSDERESIRIVAKRKGFEGDEVEKEIDARVQSLPVRGDLNDLSNFVFSLPFLYAVSAVTYPHEAYTRYSDGKITPKEYTMEMGIVRATPELNRRTMKVIESIISII